LALAVPAGALNIWLSIGLFVLAGATYQLLDAWTTISLEHIDPKVWDPRFAMWSSPYMDRLSEMADLEPKLTHFLIRGLAIGSTFGAVGSVLVFGFVRFLV